MQPLALATPATVASDTAKDKANNRVFIRFSVRLGGCGLHSVAPSRHPPLRLQARQRGLAVDRFACRGRRIRMVRGTVAFASEYRPKIWSISSLAEAMRLFESEPTFSLVAISRTLAALKSSSVDFPGM
jgi:hypothetical protein